MDGGSPSGDAPGYEAERANVEIVLSGSVAVVSGVVDRLEDRERILRALGSLDSLTRVEDDLRLRAA
jgi:hypothetical protein